MSVWIKRLSAIAAGGAAMYYGGTYAFKYYMHQQVETERERKVTERLAKHFEDNQRMCDMTLASFLTALRAKLTDQAGTTALSEALNSRKLEGQAKLDAWQRLMVLTISKVLAAWYGVAVLAVVVRAQVNIIARQMYNDKMRENQSGQPAESLPMEIKAAFLKMPSYLIEQTIAQVFAAVRDEVDAAVAAVPLQERFTADQFLLLLRSIVGRLRSQSRNFLRLVVVPEQVFRGTADSSSSSSSFDYMDSTGTNSSSNSRRNPQLCALTDELYDILDYNDTAAVVEAAVDACAATLAQQLTQQQDADAPFAKYGAKLETHFAALFSGSTTISAVSTLRPMEAFGAVVYGAV